MTDFYLHKYKTTESIYLAIVAPHKYRLPLTKKMNNQQICIDSWNKGKKKIVSDYLNNVKEIYKKDETFFLFTPPTRTRIFVVDIIESIKQEFPNLIDLTNVFTKIENVSFGDSKYDNYSNQQLSQFIEVDTKKLKIIDEKVNKAFIVDDVCATGKSLNLTKYLIRQHYDNELEIKSGVILTTA